MRSLALVLALAACEGTRVEPWVAYSATDGTSLGVNDDRSQFVNKPNGDVLTVGLRFVIPLATPDRIDWPERAPNYALPVLQTSAGWTPPQPQPKEEKDIEERALRTIKQTSPQDILTLTLVLAILIVAAAVGITLWKRYKSNGAASGSDDKPPSA